MTFNDKEAIGDLVIQYNQNEQRLAALKHSINDIGSKLSDLGRMVREEPSRIRVTDEVFSFAHDRNQVSREALYELSELLAEFDAAIGNKKRMEDCLRQAGLDKLIQSPPSEYAHRFR